MKVNLKKVVSVLLLVFYLSLTAVPNLEVFASATTSAVVIEDIKVNKKTVNKNESVSIEIKLANNSTKVDRFEITSSINGKEMGYTNTLEYDRKTGTYKGKIFISGDSPSGVFSIKKLDAFIDYSRITVKKTDVFNKADVTILNKELPFPKLKSFTTDKKEYKSGETIVATVDVENHRSDNLYISLKYGYGAGIKTSSSEYLGNGKYRVKLNVPYYIKSEEMNLEALDIKEDDENGLNLYHESMTTVTLLSKIKIIGNGTISSKSPVIKSAKIDKRNVKVGEKIKISANVEDKDNDLESVVIQLVNNKNELVKTLNYNKDTKLYEGEILINDYMKNGMWYIVGIKAYDINGNLTWSRSDTDVLFDNLNFNVTGSKELQSSKTTPIKSISLNKSTYQVGEIVKASVKLDEPTNLKGTTIVTGMIEGLYEFSEPRVFTYNKDTDSYEFQYRMKENRYSSYTITVEAENIYKNITRKSVNFKLNNTLYNDKIKVDSFTTDKASAQQVGTKIKLTSNTNVSGAYYEFYAKEKNDTKWTKLKGMGPANYAYWTPEKAGEYTLRVRAKNSSSSNTYDCYKDIKFVINEKATIKSLTTSLTSPSKIGEKITVKATSNITNGHYEFYVKEKNDTKWTKLKGMGPASYAYWTPSKSGEYTIRVRAKNSNSSNTYDCYKDIKFTVYNPIKITSLTTNKPSGTKVGTKITVTAGPKLDDAHYEFYVKDASGTWTKLKGMGPKNYAYWTPEKAGKYTIRVRSKNVNSPNKYDSYKDISFTVNK